MEIITAGLNHKTASVKLREKISFSERELPSAYKVLLSLPFIQESLILSTCNRVELYAAVNNSEEGISQLKEFLSNYHRIPLEEFEKNLYVYQNKETLEHLFSVASGLDSMVIGETQILGQLKKAYLNGLQYSAVGNLLGGFLQEAFAVTKKLRDTTDIDKGLVSVGSVAVKLAEEALGQLSGRKVMIIGAGKISGLILKYLTSKGAASVFVANRTYEKACQLAREFRGKAVRFSRMKEFLLETDILISSTSAPHFVIRKDDIAKAVEQRKFKPLFLIDLAVPRDIQPEAGEVRGVHLYDIDDLQNVVDKNISFRQKETEKCRRIIKTYIEAMEQAAFRTLVSKPA